jgi:long-chain-fatty-acid--[acyl-carrier-protein] ligase
MVACARLLLSLRYRIRLVGLTTVVARGVQGILLLPNHPALIDPFVLAVALFDPLRPLFLADSRQINRFMIRNLARAYGMRPLPDVNVAGTAVRAEVERSLADCAAHLREGGNVVMYPSGHLYRSRYENLRGNSAAQRILNSVPDARVVLVRIRGFWGSGFSHAGGREPEIAPTLKRAALGLLQSGLFFAPHRQITIELVEPADLPRATSREDFNARLEAYYNEDAPPNRFVPYSAWDRGGARDLPDPAPRNDARDTTKVPTATRQLVLDHLKELSGLVSLTDSQDLARDLALDSLARAEVLVWIQKETGLDLSEATSLQTVADVLLAAVGEATSTLSRRVESPPRAWFVEDAGRCGVPATARTIPEAFLDLVDQAPGRLLVADATSGARSAADLLTAVLVLKPLLRALPGTHVGVLLPASVAAATVFLACHFAGKVPVMLNWTIGERGLLHAVDTTSVSKILTSKTVIERLTGRGVALSAIASRFVLLEELVKAVPKTAKLRAFATARVVRRDVRRAIPTDTTETAVVLFTSGSESLPKAVPLSHENVLRDLEDAYNVLYIRRDDTLIGMLPPFHSFGLTVCIGGALAAGMRVAYYPDPTDSGMLAQMVESYRATMLIGTPTFVTGILRAGTTSQLGSVRLAISGAESAPDRLYALFRDKCPNAKLVEGYGITECSPIVALNREEDPRPGTVGRPLPRVEYAVVDLAVTRRLPKGERGLLLVRGPNVFRGYLGGAASPFVDFEGRRWYRTGDLVSEGDDAILTVEGRLARFVKIGGEMVSLPAIEAVLEPLYPPKGDQKGPVLAIVSRQGADRPEIVLVASFAVERAEVNAAIQRAGLSALHNVREVVRVPQIPTLGTGKTDYRSL